jgi:hypothetical protein
MPVIVAAGGHHAFTLVGYRRVDAGTPDERIHFIRQDDESGPYQLVEDFAHDKHGDWDWLIVPLPPKVFVPGEVAESLGKERLLETAEASEDPACQLLVANAQQHAVSFRSTVVQSNRFKASLIQRGFDTKAAALYRRLPLPRWVWVVEAIQREQRAAGTPAVVAEAVIDATDHSRDPHVLAWRVPGSLWTWLPDQDKVGDAALATHDLVDSIARYTSDEPLPAQPS